MIGGEDFVVVVVGNGGVVVEKDDEIVVVVGVVVVVVVVVVGRDGDPGWRRMVLLGYCLLSSTSFLLHTPNPSSLTNFNLISRAINTKQTDMDGDLNLNLILSATPTTRSSVAMGCFRLSPNKNRCCFFNFSARFDFCFLLQFKFWVKYAKFP